MPPRPRSLPLVLRPTISALPLPCPPSHPGCQLHCSASRRAEENALTHYEVLSLAHNASAADIKRQYIALTKQHHPDRNPDDPAAAARFVRISEAYHVLSAPEKRAAYDQSLQASASRGGWVWGRPPPGARQGSYSSASFAGSRPATGLNKKRGTFRGPPPSFYRGGGYGDHGAKRAEYVQSGARFGAGNGSTDERGEEQSSDGDGRANPYAHFAGGFGPGQAHPGQDVPHFDDVRHQKRHQDVNRFIQRHRTPAERPRSANTGSETGLFNFAVVGSMVAFVGVTVKLLTMMGGG